MSNYKFPGHLSDPNVLRAFSGVTVLLCAKMFATGLAQAFTTDPKLKAPEDESYSTEKFVKDEESFSRGHRFGRIYGNDCENIPMDLAVLFLCALAGGGSKETTCKLIKIYAGLRIAHSAVYVFGLQPYRTLAYAASKGVVFYAGYLGLRAIGCCEKK